VPTLTSLIFIAVCSTSFLASIHVAPGPVKFVPEALSGIAAISVVLLGPRQQFRFVAPRYWIVFGGLALVVACGILINGVAPGPLLQGVRFYLRPIPMFFLPAVFAFSEQQIRNQLRLLGAIALLQLPISVYQRYIVLQSGRATGDPVFGTLMISSIMSVFLIACMCVAAALTLRGRMNKTTFFLLFVLFVIPTTINETKATVFLLPIGLLATFVLGSAPGKRLRLGIAAVLLLAVFGALFIPIYNFFASVNNPYPYTIQSFFGNERIVKGYVEADKDVGSTGDVGRVDSVVVPLQLFADDPVHLMLGVGIGNTSGSSLGSSYDGEYAVLLGRYTKCTSASAFLVEMGVIGFALVMLLYWMIFRDSMALAARDGTILGSLALGWVGVTAVVAIATFYKDIHAFESLSYLFWYFSGLIAAGRTRLALAPVAPRTPMLFARPVGPRV
jgi:hypothetical protein